MIFCNQCGNSLPDNLLFCSECGAAVPISSKPSAPPTLPSFAPPLSSETVHHDGQPIPLAQRERKANPLPWIITSFVILLSAIIIIYSNSKSGSNSYATSYNSNEYTNYNQGNLNNSTSNRNANIYRSSNLNSNTGNSNIRSSTSNDNSSTTPQNWTLAYCNANTLNVRSAPVLDLSKSNQLGELRRGDQVWIIRESSNYDTYNGVTSNWAEIKLANGSLRGWVFRYYLEPMENGD